MLLSKLSILLAKWLSVAVYAGTLVHDEQFIPDHILRVSVAQVPSACENREDVVVNGTSPGPAIHLLPGARTWIRVYNDMNDRNLSMHWHGLSQRFAPFSDGTPSATQWPIPPGHFFDYEILTEPEDAGTYFYHSHVGMQALSCTGPLIVEDCGSSPYHYDDERILLFQDHFQKSDLEMIQGLTSTQFTWTGETRGILLNGRGVSPNQAAVQGRPGEASGFFGSHRFSNFRAGDGTSNSWDGIRGDDQIEPPTDCTLPVIDVEPGKTYRLRFIGATGLSLLTMGFEDHNDLTIVQVDGSEYNAPVTVDHIQLGGGQRFDVLLRTKTAEELRCNGDKTTYFLQFETRDRPDPYRGYGVLRYNLGTPVPAAPTTPALTLPAEVNNWLEYTFQPLHPSSSLSPTAEEVTRRVILEAEQKIDPATGRLVWKLAHMTWTDMSRDKPVLVDIYERGEAAMPDYAAALTNYGWDPATKLFPAKKDEVLEIVIQNTGSHYSGASGIVETHPFHAHGQHFYDVGSGPGKYDPEANNAKLASLGYRPIKRDTTMVYRYGEGKVAPGEPAGWRAWRMKMNNPGVWMVHCHILAHMIMGMETIWVVGDAEDIVTIPLSVSQNYFTYGGSVYGNDTHAPEVYHYFDDTNKCCAAGAGDSEDSGH
ncbi:laccase-like protein [Thermothelomyces thermophilus ATCC 42464]|uniref:Laccase-like multicopper oxidase 1 n=1 Tax=Thermothelomyces thermophilus (strain ATCC 42464 / BCRC 31852 / DSM 1799) TaxID=573729 RepID=LMCO1_THET4|nr:laccase-like protein [Thermothelomyces thermophilus ATCC 42464]G2QFD0.1 RecName: Full=Laccase-like multicopper oxidase 1; Short=LMCO; Flags: Precursor [Thermothelomyces thermophilus ATCC 42464]AEO59159.1 laccase-like protein [Thermothelomyces thermophilus ATCC 42464]